MFSSFQSFLDGGSVDLEDFYDLKSSTSSFPARTKGHHSESSFPHAIQQDESMNEEE